MEIKTEKDDEEIKAGMNVLEDMDNSIFDKKPKSEYSISLNLSWLLILSLSVLPVIALGTHFFLLRLSFTLIGT